MPLGRYRITKHKKGWVKKLRSGKTAWIAALSAAPTLADAEKAFEAKVAEGKIRLEAAPAPTSNPDEVLIEDMAESFLQRKRKLAQLGKIQTRTFEENLQAIRAFKNHLGEEIRFCDLTPLHFSAFADTLSERLGVHRLKKFIILVRGMFRWAGPGPGSMNLVSRLPQYGDGFRLPSRADLRRSRKESVEKFGVKMYEPWEIAEQLAGKDLLIKRRRNKKTEKLRIKRRASRPLRAMILLGLNCGFGNTDCAELPLNIAAKAIDDGWISYARGKTGADRLAYLWPETRTAMREYLGRRPKPRDKKYAGLFFLTQPGQPWIEAGKDQIGMRHVCLLDALGHRRRGFRSYRRTFRTLAAQTGQELAIDLIMGHADRADDMAKVYTVEVSREIVRQVCEHVRQNVFSFQPQLFAERG
jgi:hypothetical protein